MGFQTWTWICIYRVDWLEGNKNLSYTNQTTFTKNNILPILKWISWNAICIIKKRVEIEKNLEKDYIEELKSITVKWKIIYASEEIIIALEKLAIT